MEWLGNMVNNTIIILNYNDSKTTKNLVNSIKNYSSIDRILIVDNASRDNSLDELKKLQDDKTEVVVTERNDGYASGNDYGCRYAIEKYNTKYITIANPDISFTDITMEKMLDYADIVGDCGIIGCMMKCHSVIDLPSAWKIPTYCDCILENLLILRKIIGNRTRYDNKYYEKEVAEVEVIAGSFFLITQEAYINSGGFDTSTFLYYEENILARRLIEKGYKNYLITNLQYDHFHSISINNTFSTKKGRLDIAYQSRKYYLKNYLNVGEIAMKIHQVTYGIGLFNYLIMDCIKEKIIKKNAHKIGGS